MSRMEALLNRRLSAIESKLDDLQCECSLQKHVFLMESAICWQSNCMSTFYLATSDSRTARLSDKVSSLQATVDYMTTLIEQLTEKAQFQQNDEKFEPVQVEAFEDQV